MEKGSPLSKLRYFHILKRMYFVMKVGFKVLQPSYLQRPVLHLLWLPTPKATFLTHTPGLYSLEVY